MTDEQTQAQIKALIEERAGYERRGMTDRVGQVDVQLKRLGQGGKPPQRRSEKRTVAP